MTFSIQVYHRTVIEGQKIKEIAEPGGYNHAAHIQFPVLFSESEKMKKRLISTIEKCCPANLGTSLNTI